MENQISQDMTFGMRYKLYQYETAVHYRCNCNKSYVSFSISVHKLVERVKKCKSDINVLSTEWMRLQFNPKNPYRKSALKYNGGFDIRYKVQRR